MQSAIDKLCMFGAMAACAQSKRLSSCGMACYAIERWCPYAVCVFV
jgi:hypothetical protein